MNTVEVHCPICRLQMSEALTVVSRHPTSTGTVVYARCQCGRLSLWRENAPATVPVVAASCRAGASSA